MELIIAPTDAADRWRWTIVYDGAAGRQERPYELLVRDAEKGRFAIDEKNSIVLETAFLDGGHYGQFVVQGNRITTFERLLDAGTPNERLLVELVTHRDGAAVASGGVGGVPEVASNAPVAVQRAVLRRGPAAGASGARDPGPGGTRWTILDTERAPGKQDDIFFVTPSIGWYANGAGKIFRTDDGGATWSMQLHRPGTFFRCLAFLDERVGFAGTIGPGYFPNVTDSTPLYRTDDGGATWTPVAIEGPPVVGLCALEIVRTESVDGGTSEPRIRIVGVGRVGGPVAMIVSDDLGHTWTQRRLPASAAMAFDVHFVDQRTGFVAAATSADITQARSLILRTDDGGDTWRVVHRGTRPYELTWKMSFPSPEVGFTTLQCYDPSPKATRRAILRTDDGGETWRELLLADNAAVRPFGIAFVDGLRGWVGATPHGFETKDGGRTWSKADFGNAVNKIRVVPDGDRLHLFAIGVEVARATVPR
jgi:photosystem II stability/assembly factor-like uncharacterized protein